MSTQGHDLNKLGSTRARDATHQLSRSSAFLFQRRRFLRVLPYIGMAAILVMGHKTICVYTHFHFPSHGGSIWNLASNSLAVSMEKKLENVEYE